MKPPPRLFDIARDIANANGMTLDELTAPERNASIVRVRVAAYLALRSAGASYPEIGAVMKRDHTTVLSAVRKARRQVEQSSPVATGKVRVA